MNSEHGNCGFFHLSRAIGGEAISSAWKSGQRLRRGVLAIGLYLLSAHVAMAADISFRLSQLDGKLTVLLQGDASAYYPAALRMLPDGSWDPLPPVKNGKIPVELTPGSSFDVQWPTNEPTRNSFPLERLQPVMVRFFEQEGVGLGQIAFFQEPVTATHTLPAEYVDDSLVIDPVAKGREGQDSPGRIHASWILWPQEEGVAPLGAVVRFEHRQPAALHIDWHSVSGKVNVYTGKGLPDVILLHETAKGLVIQRVAGAATRRQPLPPWIDASPRFYQLAAVFAAAALLAILAGLVRTRHRQRQD